MADGQYLITGDYSGRLWYSDDTGSTWTEQTPAGSADKLWRGCFVNNDGTIRLAGIYNLRLYLYSSGSWAETRPAGDANKGWCNVSGNSDGSILVAPAYPTGAYIYKNSSWSEITVGGGSLTNAYYSSVSTSGQYIIIASYQGRVYMSSDYGENFAETQPIGDSNGDWFTAAISDAGKALVGILTGRLYYYNGSSWSETQPAGDADRGWRGSCFSDGNSTMYASYSNGRLYKSTDASSWTEIQPAGDNNRYWICTKVSYDGSVILTQENSQATYGDVFLSTDSGSNWSNEEPGGVTFGNWQSCDVSRLGATVTNFNATVLSLTSSLGTETVTTAVTFTATALSLTVSIPTSVASETELFNAPTQELTVTVNHPRITASPYTYEYLIHIGGRQYLLKQTWPTWAKADERYFRLDSANNPIRGPIVLSPSQLTTPEAGAIEYYNDRFHITNVAVQRPIDRTSDVITETTTVANTTTETTLYTGTLEANALKEGNLLKVICGGVVSNANPTHIVTIRVKIGSQTVASVTNGGSNSLSNTPWDIEYRTTVRSVGTTGSVVTHVHLGIEGEGSEDITELDTVDTTVAENITITAQWDTADAGDTISIYEGFMEFKN